MDETKQEPTMNTDAAYNLIFGLAYSLNQATLVGRPAPIVKEMRDRIATPLPGDWVVETSTIRQQNRSGVGRLILVRQEPIPGAWEEGEQPEEDAWHLETLEGQHVRWVNCTFIALPHMLAGRPFDVEDRAGWQMEAVKRHGLEQTPDAGRPRCPKCGYKPKDCSCGDGPIGGSALYVNAGLGWCQCARATANLPDPRTGKRTCDACLELAPPER